MKNNFTIIKNSFEKILNKNSNWRELVSKAINEI